MTHSKHTHVHKPQLRIQRLCTHTYFDQQRTEIVILAAVVAYKAPKKDCSVTRHDAA